MKKFSNFINESKNDNFNIEFSILKPNLNIKELTDKINDAIENNIRIISTLVEYVDNVKNIINNKPIKISAVIDFPNGTQKHKLNIKEISKTISKGIDEIELTLNTDIFIKPLTENNIEKLKNLEENLKEISYLCHRNGIIFKVILNINDLNLDQIKTLSKIVINTDVDYIQTSTGNKTDFKKANFLKKILPNNIKIKIAGEIRNIQDIKQYNNIADRFGTSVILL